MSVSSLKVITAPISVHEVANMLHEKPDIATLCCAKDKINPWSKHKPLDSSLYPELTEEQMAAVNYGLDLYQCAVGTMAGSSVGGGIYAVDQLGVGAQTGVYHSPADSSTAKYRLSDFNGYKHKGRAYRWPIKFYPVEETIVEYRHEIANFGVNVGGTYHFSFDNINKRMFKTWGRENQNTAMTYTGIHVTDWGGGLTYKIKGNYECYVIDSNNRKVGTSGVTDFSFGQHDIGDQHDSLRRVGLSISKSGHFGGKGPGSLHIEIKITYIDTEAPTATYKAQMQFTPIFSFAEYISSWPEYVNQYTGFMVKIPECSGDGAENDHAYEKELLHYGDPGENTNIYCLDPMFILLLEDGSGNQLQPRYGFPSAVNSDFITPGDMGLGVYGDLRSFIIRGLYMFYCNKEKVYRSTSTGAASNFDMYTDTINTTNTVIFPAPYCKWDWDSIKKS